jgi:hypothetical protein
MGNTSFVTRDYKIAKKNFLRIEKVFISPQIQKSDTMWAG